MRNLIVVAIGLVPLVACGDDGGGGGGQPDGSGPPTGGTDGTGDGDGTSGGGTTGGETTPPPQSCSDASIAIVGAGAAGLYAAYELDRLGASVTVLEASSTHGGRIRALDGFADFSVELGAESVHGSGNQNGNPDSFLYRDIQALDPNRLQPQFTERPDQDELYAIDDGAVYDQDYDDAEIDDVWTWLEDIFDYTGPDVPASEVLLSEMGIGPGDRTWHFYEAYLGGEYGTSLSRLGAASLAKEGELWLTGEDNFAIDGGSYLGTLDELYFQSVLDAIVFDAPVTAIDYGGDTAVHVTHAGGDDDWDAVLVTVPITVLQRGMIEFTPDLPAEKTAAIDAIGMDAGMKIALRFSPPFWDTDRLYGLLTKGDARECWLPGKLKTGATNDVILCYIMGESAERMSAMGAAAIDQALADLDAMFGGNAATAAFVEGHIQDWSEEPYILGAFSYTKPGTYPEDGGPSARELLASPVAGKLFFAGEATARNHPGTVHGALESGRRAAQEICASFGG